MFFRCLKILLAVLFLFSCEQLNYPDEGENSLNISVKIDSIYNVENLEIEIRMISIYGSKYYKTDPSGNLLIKNLTSGFYKLNGILRTEKNILFTANKDSLVIKPNTKINLTLNLKPKNSSGITINEIYVSGPQNNQFYISDQFIELYNSSDSVKYLDGMIFYRMTKDFGGGPGADYDKDGDIDGVTYAFKFPGKPGESNYPIFPNEFKVIAQKAINHRKFISKSIDLSNSDFEFYNQYSSLDIDNPNSINLENIIESNDDDFILRTTSDILILAKGTDLNWSDGIDINDIIDGIEYQSSNTSLKSLDYRVDESFINSPPRYSGYSMQRIEPGIDTNNGQLDWKILYKPTPGFQ